MKTVSTLILFLFLNLASANVHAQIQFVENKGQWNNNVKFKMDLSAGAFFLTAGGFTVLQHNTSDLKKLSAYYQGEMPVKSGEADNNMTLHSHSYEVTFAGGLVPAILPAKALTTYNNYFIGNDQAKWAGNCKIYQAVTYKNIYPGIDVAYYAGNGNLKYDFIVHPGADVSNIKMQYTGIEALRIVNDELIVKTSVAEVREMAPYAYEEGNKKRVACKFKIEANIVSFETGAYDSNKTFVIDPTVVFSTLTGSTADNWGHAATYGPDGCAYAAGVVFDNGYPVSPGAFETVFQGGIFEDVFAGYDMGIIKFSPDGISRIYATYLGGNSNESPLSLVTDTAGNLIIAARTRSVDYPTTLATYGSGGNYDIAITKLNAFGNGLIASRKMGGLGQDGVNIRLKYTSPLGAESLRRNYADDIRSMVILDTAQNIIVSSETMSNDFPVTAGAFQNQFGGGQQDGVIFKTSPDLSNIIFSSFIGGSANDAAFALSVNRSNNNVYIAGNTESPNIPGNRSGVLQPNFQGGTDGFISIITENGSSIIKSTYLGTSSFDILYYIQVDSSGFAYVTGTTNGTWPVINAPFSQAGGKQFIAKLQPDLSAYVYSTVFGTNTTYANISATAFFVDACENVYVSGWGGNLGISQNYNNSGTGGMLTTPDAVKALTDSSDFYIFVLQKNAAAVLYASFYGAQGGVGDHIDGGTSNFDKDGILYQAVCHCESDGSDFPTSPGAWSTVPGSPGCNQAVFKIAFDFCLDIVPVHIVYFKGRTINTFHELQWEITNEEAGDEYFVEKRTNVNDPFLNVYTTATNATRPGNTYNIQLPAGNFPETFYRLKTISHSGRISYSPIVRLNSQNDNKLIAYIVQNTLKIYTPDNTESVALFSIDGKLIQKDKTNSAFISLPLDNVAHGILIIKVQLKGQEIIKKIYY